MIIYFNLAMIFIIIIYIVNSYFLSVKQNIIKILSFLFRIILAWYLASGLSRLILKINISNSKYEFNINGKVINNITDIFKVLIIENFPEFSFIINQRSIALPIIESVSLMLIRTILLILCYFLITLIHKIINIIIKRINKKKQKPKEEKSKQRGLAFGLIQGIIIAFLVCIPLSGLSSLTNDILRLDENITESKEITFIKNYRDTITGKAIAYLNINNKPLDMYFFDRVFAVELAEKKIFIAEELSCYVDIIEIIEAKDIKNIDEETLNSLDEEFINKFILKINELKSLNISAPMLIDYFLINYFNITLNEDVYEVDYYNETIILGDLLVLYLNESKNLNFDDLFDNDPNILSRFLRNLSALELLDKLSPDISKELLSNEVLSKYIETGILEEVNLGNVNYKQEVGMLSNIFDLVFEIEKEFNSQTLEEISEIIYASNLLMDNDELLLNLLADDYLSQYNSQIKRMPLEYEDIKSLITLAKLSIDNGFLDPYFRLTKLNDDKTMDDIINALTKSNLMLNNLSLIFKLYLKESQIEIDFNLIIPDDIDFKSEEGKKELKELFKLFQILSLGLNQENLEENLDQICFYLDNSRTIKNNLNNFINWGISKYNPTNYNIFLYEIDFLTPEGDKEIKNIIEIIKLLVNKRILDYGLMAMLDLSKDDIDIILSSKIIEEASIHLLCDLGKDEGIPLVVNIELDDPLWYKTSRNAGELRNLIYAIKIIFKDVQSIEDIELTPDLILSIDDGTIDTNKDGVVDEKDENELFEIMKSKILMDSVVKFMYDYYKNLNQ